MIEGALVKYDAMCHAIDQAYRVDEVKDLRDKAAALEAYARQAKNTEAERRACEIRLRAERKAGQLLQAMAKSKERAARGGDRKSKGAGRLLKLADLNVSPDQSKRWQKLADVPEQDFEQALAEEDKPSTGGIIERSAAPAEPAPPQPVSREALWLWGRLLDFERDYINREPGDVLATLTPEMFDDVRHAAPLVVSWLTRIVQEVGDGKAQAAA